MYDLRVYVLYQNLFLFKRKRGLSVSQITILGGDSIFLLLMECPFPFIFPLVFIHAKSMSKLFWKSSRLSGNSEVMDIGEEPTTTTLLKNPTF